MEIIKITDNTFEVKKPQPDSVVLFTIQNAIARRKELELQIAETETHRIARHAEIDVIALREHGINDETSLADTTRLQDDLDEMIAIINAAHTAGVVDPPINP